MERKNTVGLICGLRSSTDRIWEEAENAHTVRKEVPSLQTLRDLCCGRARAASRHGKPFDPVAPGENGDQIAGKSKTRRRIGDGEPMSRFASFDQPGSLVNSSKVHSWTWESARAQAVASPNSPRAASSSEVAGSASSRSGRRCIVR